jgi:citronellol/citronellal dehydrogenase
MMKLKDRVAIVTGASRGLGKAIALGFAREGADIVVAARSEVEDPRMPGTIQKTAEEIHSLGRSAMPVKCDVTKEEDVSSMAQRAVKEFGHVDILVNNAGVAFYFPVAETPLKRWELVLRVNLVGAFLVSKAVLPYMTRQKSGSIINISSLAADERHQGTVPTGVAYAVSKAGLDRFTIGLAVEEAKNNIAVNALKPQKIIDTEGMRFWMKDSDKSQWTSPEKMVKAAVHMAAQDATGITAVVATDEEFCAWHNLI